MERFAKRKIRIFDYRNCYRVFYVENSGKKYFVGEYSKTMNIEFISMDVKNWYNKRKRKGMYHVVSVDGFLHEPVTTSDGYIKYFETINDAEEWIDKHSYAGMSFKYEVIDDEADN